MEKFIPSNGLINKVEQKKPETASEILPWGNEIGPIPAGTTFGECGFNTGEFESLSSINKLRIATDLIRQSMLVDYEKDTELHLDNLRGDCLTANLALREYLNRLGIEGSCQICLVKRRPFDPPDRYTSRHLVTEFIDVDGKKFLIDPTPAIGYGFGQVTDDPENLYDYKVISESDVEDINIVIEARKLLSKGGLLPDDVKLLSTLANTHHDEKHFHSWINEAYYIIASYYRNIGDTENYQKFLNYAIKYDKYKFRMLNENGLTEESKSFLESGKYILENYTQLAIKNWEELARESFSHNTSEGVRNGIRYLQQINSERDFIQQRQIPSITVGNKKIPLYNLTPRMLNQLGLTTVWIKPSVYRMGILTSVKEELKKYEVVDYYEIDLLEKGKYGYSPLIAGHPEGEKNRRLFYGGKTIVYLLKTDPGEMRKHKLMIRSKFGKYLGRSFIWSDGLPIEWPPELINHIHSADNAAESLVHYMVGKPEYSIITRWNYPNRRL